MKAKIVINPTTSVYIVQGEIKGDQNNGATGTMPFEILSFRAEGIMLAQDEIISHAFLSKQHIVLFVTST